MWTATYDDPMTWSALETPGTPEKLSAGVTEIQADTDHHIIYTAAQAAGLWRVVTE